MQYVTRAGTILRGFPGKQFRKAIRNAHTRKLSSLPQDKSVKIRQTLLCKSCLHSSVMSFADFLRSLAQAE